MSACAHLTHSPLLTPLYSPPPRHQRVHYSLVAIDHASRRRQRRVHSLAETREQQQVGLAMSKHAKHARPQRQAGSEGGSEGGGEGGGEGASAGKGCSRAAPGKQSHSTSPSWKGRGDGKDNPTDGLSMVQREALIDKRQAEVRQRVRQQE